MRIGQNPAKFIKHVAKPQNITVAIITYIPFLGSYYSESLEVLKLCLNSLWENTDLPYDLFIFDNASCDEVRKYLFEMHNDGKIQYLLLSDKNIGKSGAWNIIFSGAPGDIIAYADSDIYFYPGWLSTLVDVLDTFPNAGMVTGIPMWSPVEFSTSTLIWAESAPGVTVEKGQLLPWEDYWRHSQSLGKELNEAKRHFGSRQDICLDYKNQKYYVGAGHFQFIARRSILQSVLPLPAERPMGQVRSLDKAINANGYLRLSTEKWWVQHLGNAIDGLKYIQDSTNKEYVHQRIANSQRTIVPRKLLVWLHNKTFELLYRNKSS